VSTQQPAPDAPPPVWRPLPAPLPREHSPFRRGFGLGLGASLGAGLALGAVGLGLVVVMVLALVGLASSGGESESSGPVTETVWGEPGAGARLIAVPVTGVILGGASDGVPFGGATYGYDVADTIDSLGTEDADGLVLELNTPGGTIYGSRAIADAVERYQKRTGNQVMAHVQGLSASGGMYAMAGADQIVADHGSLVGSIGVVMGPFQRFRDVTGIPGSLLEPGVTTEGGITEEYFTRGRGKTSATPTATSPRRSGRSWAPAWTGSTGSSSRGCPRRGASRRRRSSTSWGPSSSTATPPSTGGWSTGSWAARRPTGTPRR
jgi:protease IV